MKPGNISTASIAPTLAMLIRDRWPHGNGVVILAEKVSCDESAIRLVLEQRNPGVSFDFADRLFCAVGRPMEDVGLADVYYAANLTMRECASPLCAKLFREKKVRANVKRYCSRACAMRAWKLESGQLTGNRLKDRCFRGHKFTPENTAIRPNGKRLCRACAKDRRRLRMQDPEYRARQRAYERKCRAKAAA